MSETNFSELNINADIMRAINEMGFEDATAIQSRAIPLILQGGDIIGKSQTGTGKTIAFGIPALSVVNVNEDSLQSLIVCPTRELAQQACNELKKLAKFMHGIRVVDIYGGAPMDRQIVRLKKANVVVGTPGRIMDHMRRRTLKVQNVKMVVLDEADEMLSMGFKEDIETILTDAPQTRQTILFSATMPKAILDITEQFQNNPQLIEIDAERVTLENITQHYIQAPMGSKLDVLNLLLCYHKPKLAMIFCNTKKMVDEVTEYLVENGFAAEGLHGDMKQSQRTRVMDGFKSGKTQILAATDVAARGIDVNGIDYVINYDIPQNSEYYVHRIGRTGRAGKVGEAITICSGRKQIYTLRDISRAVKSEINELSIPTISQIKDKNILDNCDEIEKAINEISLDSYYALIEKLEEKGYSAKQIAAAAMWIGFNEDSKKLSDIAVKQSGGRKIGGSFGQLEISIGRNDHAAPNHIVAAISEAAEANGIDLENSDIGKIDIYDDKCVVGIEKEKLTRVADAMQKCKICGKAVSIKICTAPSSKRREYPSDGKRGGGRAPRRSGGFKRQPKK